MVGVSVLLGGGALVLPGATAVANPAGLVIPQVPRGFVGMNADGPLFNSSVNLAGQLDRMVASGVERLRVTFDWGGAQPYARCADVPPARRAEFTGCPGGVPTDFQTTDQIVTLAAQRHLPLLPVVMYSPAWDASPTGSHIRPAHDAPYAGYLKALVERYGPRGAFWSHHPSLPRDPITEWQIWNEPDLTYYWNANFAPGYVALLRVARQAVMQADPRATVVLASLTNYGWRDLASIYKVHGSRQLFDAVAADVYTQHPSGVITILRYYRQVMAQHGDGQKRVIAAEVGWPSDRSSSSRNPGFSTTERGQATKLSQLLPLLAKNRHQLKLGGFFYYTWLSTDRGGPRTWFYYSGLLHFDPASRHISAKPAYWAFRRTVRSLEG